MEYKGWELPEGEEHLQELIDIDYEYKKYEKLKPYLKDFRWALDVGAHVGWWSAMLSGDFEGVIAFEPVEEHIKCWLKNVSLKGVRNPNVKLIQTAVGRFGNSATMAEGREGNTGMRYMEVGTGSITMDFLDGLIPQEMPVDFLKIDTEGMEFDVLLGAQALISRCKPVIYFEDKGHSERYGYPIGQCRRFLEVMGYKLALVDGSDYLMVSK